MPAILVLTGRPDDALAGLLVTRRGRVPHPIDPIALGEGR